MFLWQKSCWLHFVVGLLITAPFLLELWCNWTATNLWNLNDRLPGSKKCQHFITFQCVHNTMDTVTKTGAVVTTSFHQKVTDKLKFLRWHFLAGQLLSDTPFINMDEYEHWQHDTEKHIPSRLHSWRKKVSAGRSIRPHSEVAVCGGSPYLDDSNQHKI